MLIGMLNWIHTRTQKFPVLRRKSPSFKVLLWNCQSTFFANFWVRRKSLSLNYGKKPNYTEILILRLHARAKIGSISLQEATDFAMENYELAMVREESIVSISYFSWSLSVRGKKKLLCILSVEWRSRHVPTFLLGVFLLCGLIALANPFSESNQADQTLTWINFDEETRVHGDYPHSLRPTETQLKS